MKKVLFALSIGAMLALSAVAAADNTLNVGADKIYQVIEYDITSVGLADSAECTACHANQAGKETTPMPTMVKRPERSVKPLVSTGKYSKRADSLTMLAER